MRPSRSRSIASATSDRTNLRCRPSLMLGRTPRRAYSSTVERGMCNSSATWSAVRSSSIPLMPGRHVVACAPRRARARSIDDAPTRIADAWPQRLASVDASNRQAARTVRRHTSIAEAGPRHEVGLEGASHVVIEVGRVNRTTGFAVAMLGESRQSFEALSAHAHSNVRSRAACAGARLAASRKSLRHAADVPIRGEERRACARVPLFDVAVAQSLSWRGRAWIGGLEQLKPVKPVGPGRERAADGRSWRPMGPDGARCVPSGRCDGQLVSVQLQQVVRGGDQNAIPNAPRSGRGVESDRRHG